MLVGRCLSYGARHREISDESTGRVQEKEAMSQAIIKVVGRRPSGPLPGQRRRQGCKEGGVLVLNYPCSVVVFVETKSTCDCMLSLFYIQPAAPVYLAGLLASFSCPELTAVQPFQGQDMSRLLSSLHYIWLAGRWEQ